MKNNCRWIYPNYTEDKDMCLNMAVEDEEVNEDICSKCSHYFSYVDSENLSNSDEYTEGIEL